MPSGGKAKNGQPRAPKRTPRPKRAAPRARASARLAKRVPHPRGSMHPGVNLFDVSNPFPFGFGEKAICFDALARFTVSTSTTKDKMIVTSLFNDSSTVVLTNNVAGTAPAASNVYVPFTQISGTAPSSIRWGKCVAEITCMSSMTNAQGSVSILRDGAWPLAWSDCTNTIEDSLANAMTRVQTHPGAWHTTANVLRDTHAIALAPTSPIAQQFYSYPGDGPFWSAVMGATGAVSFTPGVANHNVANIATWDNLYIVLPHTSVVQEYQVCLRACVQAKFAPGTLLASSESIQPTAPEGVLQATMRSAGSATVARGATAAAISAGGAVVGKLTRVARDRYRGRAGYGGGPGWR